MTKDQKRIEKDGREKFAAACRQVRAEKKAANKNANKIEAKGA